MNRKQKRSQRAEHPLRSIFRSNLRNRRVELNRSQREIGEAIGTTQQWVQQLEDPSQDIVPSLYQLHDISVAMGCQAHDMLVDGRFQIGVAPDDDMRLYGKRRRH